MLGVIGWNEAKASDSALRAYVQGQAANVVTLEANGLWVPEIGDVISDGTLSDVVVRVVSPTEVHTRTSTGFSPGFHAITPKFSRRLRSVADFVGNVTGSDDASRRESLISIGGGNTIEDTISADDDQYHPTGWEFASVVIITPTVDGVAIEGAHWASWQNVKLLMHSNSGPERFVVRDTSGLLAEDDIRVQGTTGAFNDIFIGGGEAFLLVRNPDEDRWRGAKLPRPRAHNVVIGADNVIVDTDNVVVG